MRFLDNLFELIGMTSLLDCRDKKKEEYYTKEIKPIKFLYRPKTLDEYIGQEKAKDKVRDVLKIILNYKPLHILLSASAGMGKTSLAQVIANQLCFKLHTFIGGSFSMENLRDFLIDNEKSQNPNILFIDETHALKREIAEFMYPIIEDFTLPNNQNTKIRPFVFIGATTEKSTLEKKFKPFVDRCGCQIQLESYIIEDIKKILKQYNSQIYKEKISEEVYQKIAENTRYTPRIAIYYLDIFMVNKNIDKILQSNRIITKGLTDIDIKILSHLKEINKPVGEETLSIIGGIDRSDYKKLVEPYLISEGYIGKIRGGRILLEKGKKLLEEIK